MKMNKTVLIAMVVFGLLAAAVQANMYAYIDVHGQAPTQQGAYDDAWQTAQEHMQFLGYQHGEIVGCTYVQGQTLWHCSMTVRCETNKPY